MSNSSSNIPEARSRIEQAIRWLNNEEDMPVASIVRELRRALRMMVRKPRAKGGEPKARKTYMTKAVRAKVRKMRELNPSLSVKAIARTFGTDPVRTARELGE